MKLRDLRMDKGWSTADLAEKAGVSQRNIRRLEQGATPQASTAYRIAQALGVRPSQIWSDEREAA